MSANQTPNKNSENPQLSVNDLPIGGGPGQIPSSDNVAALVASGFYAVTMVVNVASQVVAHGLGRAPTFVHYGLTAGTTNAAAQGLEFPLGGISVVSDSVNVTVNTIGGLPATGYTISILAG